MIHEQYKMVVINLIALLLTTIVILIYKYLFKKTLNKILILVLISLLPLISLLRAGTYESGDFSINIYKAMAFYQSLSEGTIFPNWAGNLNATYGYPLFIFTYPLPYYIISLFHFIGFSFVASLKVLLAVSFIASGITMYVWMKEETNKQAALFASIIYLYTPYHLIDLHYRISIGEILSFIFLPLGFLSIKNIVEKQTFIWFLFTGSSFLLLLLCNQAIALISVPILFFYGLFIASTNNNFTIRTIISLISAMVTGLLISAFYWIPVLIESKYTHASAYAKQVGYTNLQELLYSPWRYGFLYQGPKGQLSYVIGYIQLLLMTLCIWYLWKHKFSKTDTNKIIFFFILFLFCLYMMLPISNIVWENYALLRNFQFTSRLLIIVAICTSFCAAIISTYLHKNIAILICFFVILTTILNWGNRQTVPVIGDIQLRNGQAQSTYFGEGFQPAATVWTDVKNPWQKTIPKNHIELLDGKANIVEVTRTSTKHIYTIDAKTSVKLKENTLYFPNWVVTANGNPVIISYTNPRYPGIITYQLPKGTYYIETTFQSTVTRKIAMWISIISAALLLLSSIYYRFNLHAKVFRTYH